MGKDQEVGFLGVHHKTGIHQALQHQKSFCPHTLGISAVDNKVVKVDDYLHVSFVHHSSYNPLKVTGCVYKSKLQPLKLKATILYHKPTIVLARRFYSNIVKSSL